MKKALLMSLLATVLFRFRPAEGCRCQFILSDDEYQRDRARPTFEVAVDLCDQGLHRQGRRFCLLLQVHRRYRSRLARSIGRSLVMSRQPPRSPARR